MAVDFSAVKVGNRIRLTNESAVIEGPIRYYYGVTADVGVSRASTVYVCEDDWDTLKILEPALPTIEEQIAELPIGARFHFSDDPKAIRVKVSDTHHYSPTRDGLVKHSIFYDISAYRVVPVD